MARSIKPTAHSKSACTPRHPNVSNERSTLDEMSFGKTGNEQVHSSNELPDSDQRRKVSLLQDSRLHRRTSKSKKKLTSCVLQNTTRCKLEKVANIRSKVPPIVDFYSRNAEATIDSQYSATGARVQTPSDKVLCRTIYLSCRS